MRLVLTLVVLALAACQQATPEALESTPAIQPKLLATVHISPTPNEAEQQATRAAEAPLLTAPAPTVLPTATVYVGSFLEAANDPDSEVPILNATEVFALIPGLPTERPSRCQIPAHEIFGETWRSELGGTQQMGCPIEAAVLFDGVVQVFERGAMYYQPNGPIWAIESTNDGFPDRQWTVTQQLPVVESIPPDIVVPQGLRVPLLGFGSVWFGINGVREALGFARTDEQNVNLAYQRFENGALFSDTSTGVVYILLSDGTAFGPF